ncbi:hypothetical protein [Pseudomonas fluorescens]|uniref:Carrier domain-containing protein n=1 Tax=Pseudomonas fluorescens TaxID=294 RepID=A0A944DE37_PSEFL|nr:hypothetical protein [Pseudomonas fluorescens]MBT2298074.1 hypothetical protein [Pseudomonas fluorescens]MBT2309803.1 hypothetical protein [Pseudomonas fluorescens]MBT2314966.1 hypothetical protein [Pseudomonas fluorescens]MBT2327872.1 hypothetical protein [Pseudomonas fluorescens]MBT2345619.1 hypothetical protein [Pseudomonas fluorescens]
MMRDAIFTIIHGALVEVNATRKEKIDLSNIDSLALYGATGVFDSMQLVSFLAAVEEGLDDELGIEISLTSEKAVSQTISPFSSVSCLMDFIIAEQQLLLASA